MKKIIDNLFKTQTIENTDLLSLLQTNDNENIDYLFNRADEKRKEIYSNKIFIRGLIEISNICPNDCYYCGIRCSNKNFERYRLSKEEIYSCAKEGYNLGFRTFVLQGGEDKFFTTEVLVEIIEKLRKDYPDCAITLSLGEKSKEEYQKLFNAGANRYLLRHETINKEHYYKLHSEKMSYEERLECLKNLKEIGFQTGCGMMIGSPFQTLENLVEDLNFIKQFKPEMVGIGPFIPHHDTPFKNFKQGSLILTLKTLSIIRLLLPNVLLPSTTALATIDEKGREMGIKAGANVIMPNLSPYDVRKKYLLYDNKAYGNSESAQEIQKLREDMEKIGYEIVVERGDFKA